MANWKDKDTCFNSLLWGLGYAKTKQGIAHAWLTDAEWRWADNEDHEAIGSLITATRALAFAVSGYVIYDDFFDPPYALAYYLKNHVESEITWKAICEAWVKDDFEGRFWTIGIIDRMRQIMWDEPFDLTWAARPEDREIPSE